MEPAAAASSRAKKKKQQDEELMLAPGSELFMVMKSQGYESDEFHSSDPSSMKPKGVYSSAEEAYAAAIRFQVAAMERIRSEKMVDLRKAIVNPNKKTKKSSAKDAGFTPLKDAYERMNKYVDSSDFFADSEVISHVVMGPCKWLGNAGSSPPQVSTLFDAPLPDESGGEDFGSDYDEDADLPPSY